MFYVVEMTGLLVKRKEKKKGLEKQRKRKGRKKNKKKQAYVLCTRLSCIVDTLLLSTVNGRTL
jgi:hypothetical protein